MTEHTCFYVKLPSGELIPAGQVYRGRVVYWSTQDTFMRKYQSFRGFQPALVQAFLNAGLRTVDLLMPSKAYRASVETIAAAPVHTVRGEDQHFLPANKWLRIPRYTKPHYNRLPTTVEIEV